MINNVSRRQICLKRPPFCPAPHEREKVERESRERKKEGGML